MTKVHEEVWAGSIGEAVERWGTEVRGEVTVVVAPATAAPGDVRGALERARALIDEGLSPSDAARQAAGETGVSRRSIYQHIIDDD